MRPIIQSKILQVLAIMVGLVLMGAACSKNGDDALTPMPLKIPSNFPAATYALDRNPITKEGFELGRKLFYDGLLSRDGTISCGSCHIQGSAFTHHGHDVSHGIDDRLGVRNSPAIMNLAWNRFFFWDGGVFDLDLQPLSPIENPVEMDEHIPNVITKLKQHKDYPALFNRVFGPGEINADKMLKALSQFMLQCVSAESKYDKYIRNEGVQLTTDELAGLTIFKQKCATCHSTDLFTDNAFHNNGLIPTLFNDSGRFRVTLQPQDMHLFKTPSLRNIAKTAPYMHDGRFLNLQAVLDHYSSGIQNSTTLDPLLKPNGIPGLPLSDTEKAQLIAFLQTLTDDAFIRNPILAEQ